jgi:hypothetical protein
MYLVVLLLLLPQTSSYLFTLKNRGISSVSDAVDIIDSPLENVTKLDLYKNKITGVAQSDFNDKFPNLTDLNMVRNKISHIEKGCFRGTPLRQIYLGKNRLTQVPDFCQVKDTLLELGLNENPITSVSFGEVNYLANLKRLTLSETHLVRITEHLETLNSLLLKGSTLVCCRNLIWIKEMGDKAQTDDSTVCSPATKLAGKEWNSISATDLRNEPCPMSNSVSETSKFAVLTIWVW